MIFSDLDLQRSTEWFVWVTLHQRRRVRVSKASAIILQQPALLMEVLYNGKSPWSTEAA